MITCVYTLPPLAYKYLLKKYGAFGYRAQTCMAFGFQRVPSAQHCSKVVLSLQSRLLLFNQTLSPDGFDPLMTATLLR
jgi:hypothetical protein